MESGKLLFLLMGFLLMVQLVYSSRKFEDDILNSFDHRDRHCFETASLELLRFRKFRVSRTTAQLWDFMENLYVNRRVGRNEYNYFSLLYDFQKMYVDCLIGKNHGLGKRHVESLQKEA